MQSTDYAPVIIIHIYALEAGGTQMAQRIYESHSPGLCIRNSKRHTRLCTQVKGADVLANAIAAPIENLKEKIAAKRAAEEAKDEFYDLIVFHDGELDNKVRTAASRCKEYDRDNPGSRTYEMIFPENTTPIIETNPAEEPAEVLKVVTRISALGEDHPLAYLAAELTEAAEKVNQIVPKYLDAITRVGTADAELQIAKSELIRQYMVNVFDAQKLFGRKMADRLFPRTSKRTRATDDDDLDAMEQ